MTENMSGVQASADSGRTARVLRFIPPVAALGTAFVLQVVVITDTVGGAMSDLYGGQWPYSVAALLGVAVASCAEGGAAYLMDLYDRHLLARDSVWLLRTAMVVYVAVSAGAIHWWTDMRGLPAVISWLLAGMSASALFLWARGSRWRNRQAMIAAGQLDPALPRLPISAKVLHPVRWLVTLYLISWEPAPTTAAARARYQDWKAHRSGVKTDADLASQQATFLAEGQMAARRAEVEQELSDLREQVYAELSALREKSEAHLSAVHAETLSAVQQIKADADLYAGQVRTAADGHAGAVRVQVDELYAEAVRTREEADSVLAAARKKADRATAVRPTPPPDSDRAVRLVVSNGSKRTAATTSQVSVEDMADSLAAAFPDSVPGRPTAIAHLKQVYGSCSNDRAREAIRVLSARREPGGGRTAETSDDQERHLGRRNEELVPDLIGALS